jgi:hypothetical protein
MSFVIADRVRETTTTTGTGTLSLDGAVVGFQAFTAVGNNNTTYYTIQGTTEWEVGIGTYLANTLSRDTVISSSSGGSKVSLSAGTKDVFVTLPAEKTVVVPASSTNHSVVRFDGTSGTVIQNSVTTIDDTGNASGILSQQFSNGSAVTLAAGKLWYNGSTGSWNLGMGGGNITQQIGEELFIYGKASTAITDSPLQIVYHTGTVGSSGVVTFAPTIAGITNANDIIGVATENLALNDFGRITTYGVVRGITTNGTAFGETWADDDVIWYNPVTGNPTKFEPFAPNIKMQIGTVITAGSGGSGSFQVLLRPGSVLGGTDSNVQFGTLANNNLIAYDSTAGYWKNVTASALGLGTVTSVGGTAPVASTGGTTPVISLAANYGDTLNPYASKTAKYVLAAPNAADGVPTFRAIVASDIPTLNQNTTGTASNVTGTVAVANGGTGGTNATDARTNLTAAKSGANTDITSIALTTGTISTAPSAGTDIVNKTYADGLAAKWGA